VTGRKKIGQLLRPVIAVLAVVYFLIDALFLSLVRPLASRLARLRVFAQIGAWVASLRPYPTLALFIVPVAILEPLKPLGAYLMASGHFFDGLLMIAVGEVLKVTLVERLFHFSRDKLLSIPWFARCYEVVTRELEWIKSLPAWQAMTARLGEIKRRVRRLLSTLKQRGPRA
jgi:hypothetical protein